jgi:penicillin-binding protein 1A
MRVFIVVALATPLLLGSLLFGLFQWAGEDLPKPRSFREVEASQKSRVLDVNGRIIKEFYVEDRSPISLSQAPRAFIDAVLATEDRQFYRHWGMDLVAILRALKADLLAGEFSQGASTITQQLARNLYLTHRRTVLRKLREAVLAIRIERAFGKDEILELYVNQIYFGEGAYGIEAAAHRFFGVSASDLTVPQSATLAGILANPSAFSPTDNPEACLSRRNGVLRRMKAMGTLTETEYQEFREEPLGLSPAARKESLAPYGTEMVRRYVVDRYGPDALFKEGLTVWTTIDLDLQAEAQRAALKHLEKLKKIYPRPRPLTTSGEDTVGVGPLQVAVVALDSQTGAIRAVVGGRDFSESPFNRAVQAKRQPGSAFKPLVYATSFERGWRPNDMLVDAPVEYEIIGVPEEDRYWSPKNFEKDFAGPVTLRYALAKSINVVSVRLLEEVGLEASLDMARRLGIKTKLPPVLSLVLGTASVTPMEMTASYATLAHHGIYTEPYIIEKVEDRYRSTLEQHTPQSESVVDARIAFLTTHLMTSVLDFGTGQLAASSGFTAPGAGKTGTTDDYTDAWFVGYTPRLALGVWVGYDRKVSIGRRATGAVCALPIWAEIMSTVADRDGPIPFSPPEGIRTVRTCLESGRLATSYCPKVVMDAYLVGTEPVEMCDLHGPFGEALAGEDHGTFRERDRSLLRRDPW